MMLIVYTKDRTLRPQINAAFKAHRGKFIVRGKVMDGEVAIQYRVPAARADACKLALEKIGCRTELFPDAIERPLRPGVGRAAS